MNIKARVIAIYLPQYHPIPENDEVWGKGFTEWTNVAQSKPLFKGHYQPRIPADFGFYDLRMPEIRELQAEYARKAGIEGFMYWQYYFGNGKKLLERPFEEVLASGKPDFPFCLGWANHSWQTKTWKRDANKKEGKTMIMEQRYDGVKQYTDHFYYNLSAFKDPRYIRVNGKPFFAIWNPIDNQSEIKLLIDIWQKLAIENGLPGIHFVAQQSIGRSIQSLKDMGFDAVYQNQTMTAQELLEGHFYWRLKNYMSRFSFFNILRKYDFEKLLPFLVTEDAKRDDVYPTLLAGYDRSPRAGRKAQIIYNFTPKTWRIHVRSVLKMTKDKVIDRNIILLKSWNEWGESNYMEPDLRYGTAMLDVLAEELKAEV